MGEVSTSHLKNGMSLPRMPSRPERGAGESLVLSALEVLRGVYPEGTRDSSFRRAHRPSGSVLGKYAPFGQNDILRQVLVCFWEEFRKGV